MSESARDVQFSELKDMIGQLNTTIQGLTATIEQKDALIARLTEEISYLKQKLFGSSSEKRQPIDPGQMTLFDQLGIEPPAAEIEPEIIKVPAHTRKKKPSLKEQFKDIPARQVFVDTLSEEDKLCPVCDTPMVPIGHEVIRTEIEFTPAKLEKIEYIATTYECPACKESEDPQFIKDNGAPPALIEGSYVTSSLAAAVLKGKFGLSLPFYRQEKDFLSVGAPISRTSMAFWTIKLFDMYLSAMTDFFHRQLLKRKFLMMDESPIQVLKEEGKRAQSKSYVWLLRSGEDGLFPIVFYHYSMTRAGDTAAGLLEGAPPGIYVMSDGYTGYNKLKDVHRCCCYAHIRRYFYDAIPKGKDNDLTLPAVQAVSYCDKLFEYERSYKQKGLSVEQRHERRLRDEKPVIESFMAWLDAQVPSSTSAKFNTALTYAKNRRAYMMTYLEDGRCSLSNNPSENSIRPVVVGRRNWLFSDTPDGATASMGMYTIIEMAKLYGLKQYEYIKYLLDHRPNSSMPDAELEALAPWDKDVQAACSLSSGNK